MDHKVSKDMISSGMIPSGEKTQADLGRTQYGSAPSPSKLMDAYKSMYGNKEEVVNEMSEMGGLPPKTLSPEIAQKKAPAKKEPPKAPLSTQITNKDAKRERLKKIMADNESVDLLAAYRSVYEHHKKDADGNTIPHDGEELNEEPITLALGALKAITAKKALAGGAKMLAGKAGLKAVAKPTVSNIAKAGGETVKRAAGNPMMQSQAMSSVNQPKEKVGKTGMVTAGADLFDIVKGQLLDEGLSEEEIKDIMLTLTPDEIMKEMNQGPSTPVKNYGDSPDKPKILPNFGATRAKPRTTDKGTLIKGGKDTGKTPAQMSQEEYKNFDPKKPDPKQMAAQAKQEKIRQKNSDPMGVKNRNIGGQGLDPMDK